ncbi:MAG: ABC transporter permease [Thermomicrobiales bacterium]|nr:ABC transporter permease [Thermomicrobiales bacterium]
MQTTNLNDPSAVGNTVAEPLQEAPRAGVAPILKPGRLGARFALPSGIRTIFRSRKATAGLIIMAFFAAVAIFAPQLAPGDPTDFVARPQLEPSSDHLFGTTGRGQDVLDQTIWGARLPLQIGLFVGLSTTTIGVIVGMTAGYFRGKVDDVLSLVMNVFLIVPALPLLVTLTAFIDSGTLSYYVFVLTVTGWAWPARIFRAQTLSLREKDFVSAARVSGESGPRIIFREILPNMTSIVAASMFGSALFAIGAQAGLEFLGLGDPSAVTWGTILFWAGNDSALLTGAWWTFVPAGACIALVAFACALVNYGIDEVTNPRLRAQREIDNGIKGHSVKLSNVRATPVLRRADRTA